MKSNEQLNYTINSIPKRNCGNYTLALMNFNNYFLIKN